MPEPQTNPHFRASMGVARLAIGAGLALTGLKFGIFWTTNSVAVLSDAFESIINVVAAAIMLYALWYSHRPADKRHPYGHGKIEFMAVGLEGWLILFAGLAIAVEAVRRVVQGIGPEQLERGIVLLGVAAVLNAVLAGYVWRAGHRYASPVLIADGKHLATDVFSTLGVLTGLVLVRWTGWAWLDPAVAVLVAAVILCASWRLLWRSYHGLMDSSEPEHRQAIHRVLDEAVHAGRIGGYHKLRHRQSGGFHWVDVHLHVPGTMTVQQSHELASAIERDIERALGRANATAHVEPQEQQDEPEAGADSEGGAGDGRQA